jgi:hypothetical protein
MLRKFGYMPYFIVLDEKTHMIMKNLLKSTIFVVLIGLSSCNDESPLCPEAQDVERTEQQITTLKYEKLSIQWSISRLNPIDDQDEMIVLSHDIFKIDLEIDRLQTFINTIKENSSCI